MFPIQLVKIVVAAALCSVAAHATTIISFSGHTTNVNPVEGWNIGEQVGLTFRLSDPVVSVVTTIDYASLYQHPSFRTESTYAFQTESIELSFLGSSSTASSNVPFTTRNNFIGIADVNGVWYSQKSVFFNDTIGVYLNMFGVTDVIDSDGMLVEVPMSDITTNIGQISSKTSWANWVVDSYTVRTEVATVPEGTATAILLACGLMTLLPFRKKIS